MAVTIFPEIDVLPVALEYVPPPGVTDNVVVLPGHSSLVVPVSVGGTSGVSTVMIL